MPVKSHNYGDSEGTGSAAQRGNVWLSNDEEEGRPGQRSARPLTPGGRGVCRDRGAVDELVDSASHDLWTCLLSSGCRPVGLWPLGTSCWLSNLTQTCTRGKRSSLSPLKVPYPIYVCLLSELKAACKPDGQSKMSAPLRSNTSVTSTRPHTQTLEGRR